MNQPITKHEATITQDLAGKKIVVTRAFDAPLEKVWRASSNTTHSRKHTGRAHARLFLPISKTYRIAEDRNNVCQSFSNGSPSFHLG
jgi:uncharacterized protein YndB with AHSA1/START domain